MLANTNTRTLLIIVGLALPIIVLGALTFHTKANTKPSVTGPSANAIENAHRSIEAEKVGHRARLAELEKMTDAQWPQDKIKNPHHAATREAAIAWQKGALARMDKMTPQQWLAEHQQEEIRRERWEAWRKAHPPTQLQTRPAQNKPLPPIGR